MPSVDQIEDYEDAVLKEIFKGKNSGPQAAGAGQVQPSGTSIVTENVNVAPTTMAKPNVAQPKANIPDYTDWTSSSGSKYSRLFILTF